MWRDFEFEPAPAGGGTLAFRFPDHGPPAWRQRWRAVIRHVAVTPTHESKEELLDSFADDRGVRTLGFVNAHALNSCVTDPVFARDLLGLDRLVRDGIGVHALYRLIGSMSGLNLNGTDLLPQLIARFAGRRVALFGTQLHLVQRVAATLQRDFGCEVFVADGFHPDGYYLEQVAQRRPDLVVLGMGMPKQERVARQMRHALHQDVAIVCGGAILDFLSGDKPRAPLWMRRSGLEWAFRLSREPRRLFGRYVIGNPLFLIRSALLATRPAKSEDRRRGLPERRASGAAFGIGGPVEAFAEAALPMPRTPPVEHRAAPAQPVEIVAQPRAAVPAPSVFSANRPVVARDDLFGRQGDIDRLLNWVLDQSGNALIYGPRGYGKTSLVRVLGEIADSRGHVVLYASCARNIAFDTLMRSYIAEIPGAAALPPAPLSVQQVAMHLAQSGVSLLLIVDEFDRVERGDTRENIIELIKDVSDLTASVRFVLVGVATDAGTILGYHPSIQRCLTCVPLTRLASVAIREMVLRKAAADRMLIAPGEVEAIVTLAGGSAYHAQLIGQKLVTEVRRGQRMQASRADLDHAVDEILRDAVLIDDGFARMAVAMRDAGVREVLIRLARAALDDPADIVRGAGAVALSTQLAGDGVLIPAGGNDTGYRFANAFMPQLLLMIAYRASARAG